MDDETLVQKCVSGNGEAQRELFDRFSPLMLGVAMRYIKDKERSEDVLQDGFIKVYKNLHRFEHKGSLEGWIRRIIVNTALDQLRKNKKNINDLHLDDSNFEIVQKSDAIGILEAEILMEIIQQLPDGYRVVFNMFAIEGYSHKEIAEALKISESTSKSQYSRAKSVLRKTLKKYNIER
ncbi:sigma-70 family RNA polymerase sigma factor [Brumimicrobium glaciale]|jgi:RNA polymerase sigma-70 factor (ECF subfamily)|uniref:Sigma-70 family RNA polymerase sigma factor n=1 Tax=Brumimicrobium glaciale TaxID=200475 RepID=A0A4Q4KNU5_9FLAO|nr:sigma-70 family RNA polymerase sigma factor [Brumimicrobium glaciale]RYM34114.1 sigma-70 family RNA polymerase sigma factor [Brumimicrobium glaciale]